MALFASLHSHSNDASRKYKLVSFSDIWTRMTGHSKCKIHYLSYSTFPFFLFFPFCFSCSPKQPIWISVVLCSFFIHQHSFSPHTLTLNIFAHYHPLVCGKRNRIWREALSVHRDMFTCIAQTLDTLQTRTQEVRVGPSSDDWWGGGGGGSCSL